MVSYAHHRHKILDQRLICLAAVSGDIGRDTRRREQDEAYSLKNRDAPAEIAAPGMS